MPEDWLDRLERQVHEWGPMDSRVAPVLPPLIAVARAALHHACVWGSPLDCTGHCGDGPCDCSGLFRPIMGDQRLRDALVDAELLTAALEPLQ